MNENRTFLGRGWSFPPALDNDGTPTRMSAYEENIRQSLWTLLSTSPGERVHQYDYEADRLRQRHPLLTVLRPVEKVLSAKQGVQGDCQFALLLLN